MTRVDDFMSDSIRTDLNPQYESDSQFVSER